MRKPSTKGLSRELLQRPGSQSEEIDYPVHTKLEHGDKTWTTGQLVRDLLQNHLDAQSEKFVEELLRGLGLQVSVSPEFAEVVWRYKKYLYPTDPQEAKHWLKGQIETLCKQHPGLPGLLGPELVNQKGQVAIEFVTKHLDSVVEKRPKVFFQFKDTETQPIEYFWVSYEEIQTPQYADVIRFPITGWRIEDEGEGFDVQLQALYASTKAMPWQRGRFGEGLKMSHLHGLRHRATFKTRSGYVTADGKHHVWQSRPVIGQDGTLHVRGVEISRDKKEGDSVGSLTAMRFEESDGKFVLDIRTEIDPRILGLAGNCLEFSQLPFQFFSGYPEVGISLEAAPEHQSVQGLRITDALVPHKKALYAYDFLDSAILGGRDRRSVSGRIEDELAEFWINGAPLELIKNLLLRITQEHHKQDTLEEWVIQKDLNPFHSDQKKRKEARLTGQRFAQACVEVFSLKKGKYVMLDEETPDPHELLAIAAAANIQVIQIQNGLSFKMLSRLSYYLEERGIYIYSPREFRKEIGGMLQDKKQFEGPVKELKQTIEEVVRAAFQGISSTMRELGLSPQQVNLNPSLAFVDRPEQTKDYLPTNLVWDGSKKQFRLICSIPSNPDAALQVQAKVMRDPKELRKRIELYALATVGKEEPFVQNIEIYRSAQDILEGWHHRSLGAWHPDRAEIPKNFLHTETTDVGEGVNPFKAREKTRERDLQTWKLIRLARSTSIPLKEIVAKLEQLREPRNMGLLYGRDNDLFRELRSRVDMSSDSLTFLDVGYEKIILRSFKLDQLADDKKLPKKVGRLKDGRPVVRLPDDRFCFPIQIPEGSLISYSPEQGNAQQWIYSAGELYSFTPVPGTEPILTPYYRFNYQGDFKLSPNGVLFQGTGDLEDQDCVKTAEKVFERIIIQAGETKPSVELAEINQVLETPITKEYGVESWDNPVRLMQDIIQNHIDAVPGEKVKLLLEVRRRDQALWVEPTQVGDEDEIIGIEIQDNGDGYDPNSINILGERNKMSPLFAGKYGEGQKMVAAASVRNELSLTYSSVAQYKGQRMRWQANADSQPVEVVVKGVGEMRDRVVFKISATPEAQNPGYTSKTTIRLARGDVSGTKASATIWKAIVETIDPRKKDKAGYAGIERYIRHFRQPNARVIDLGYIKILLDEPGVIYENGLLVESTVPLTVGYDVPSITNTRERNAVDRAKLAAYIQTTYNECEDPRFIEQLVKRFFQHTWNKVQNKRLSNAEELDQQWDLPYYLFMFRARPLWDSIIQQYARNVFIHSEEEALFLIQHSSDPEGVKRGLQMRQAAQRLKNYMVLNINMLGYSGLKNFFPTSAEVGESLALQTVEASPDTIRLLAKAVAYEAGVLQGWEGTRDPSVEKKVESWAQADELINQGRIAVTPGEALYMGIASAGKSTVEKIGITEKLLRPGKAPELLATIQHELLHQVTQSGDFSQEFLVALLSVVRLNLQRQAFGGKVLRAAENFLREE